MRRLIAALTTIGLVAGAAVGVSLASHGSDSHSDNMSLIANFTDGGTYRVGTDMAFWGDLALLGTLDQGTGPNASPPGGFRMMDVSDPRRPREIGQFECWGDQSDVSIWEDLVVLSVDKPTTEDCSAQSGSWEGIRIIDISDKSNPQIVKSIATHCGSHTNTIYPDLANRRLIVYVLSYPLAGRYNPAGATPTCNAQTHRKISVVTVPLDDPAGAELIGMPSVGETIGCHDVTVFLPRNIAGAACLTESQIWDLSDPTQPKIVARIRNPQVNIHHSTTFSNDGRTIVIGDELGGAAASPGCFGGDAYELGGLFFYDVADAAAPSARGTYKLPRTKVSEFCTAHLFNVVPMRTDTDILVSSWYTGATSVIDFTDPSKPTEIAHYIPSEPVSPDEQPTEAAAWASYWYNGHVFANNFDEDVNSVKPQSRGLDVFRVDDPFTREAVRLERLNPQLQEALPGEPQQPGAAGGLQLPAAESPGSPEGAPAPPGASRRATLRLVRNRLRVGRLRIELRGTLVGQIRAVTFRLNGRVVRVDRRRPFRVTLRLREPTRRVLRIKATVSLADGSRRTLRRTLTPRRLRGG
jgi:LVIVD repeat